MERSTMAIFQNRKPSISIFGPSTNHGYVKVGGAPSWREFGRWMAIYFGFKDLLKTKKTIFRYTKYTYIIYIYHIVGNISPLYIIVYHYILRI